MKRQPSQRTVTVLGTCLGLVLLVAGAAAVPNGNTIAKMAGTAAPKTLGTIGKHATVVRTTAGQVAAADVAPSTAGVTTTVAPSTTTASSITAPPTTVASTKATTATRAPAVVAPTGATAPAPTTAAPDTAPPPTTASAPPTTSAPPPTAPPTTAPPANSGDLPGWKLAFREDFSNDAALGSFASVYGSRFGLYEDGWQDTAGKNEGAAGRYYPSRVLSVQGGVLNEHLHSENGINMGAAIIPKIGAQLYGRYSVRFRADSVAGYKVAWLLWPQNEIWPQSGEVDFPEGDLNGTMSAFMHRLGASSGSDQDAFSTGLGFSSWHTATIEWSPDKVVFILDNQVLGTSTSRIPNTPMNWVLQTETCIGNCQPDSAAVADVQIDWVAAYTYNP